MEDLDLKKNKFFIEEMPIGMENTFADCRNLTDKEFVECLEMMKSEEWRNQMKDLIKSFCDNLCEFCGVEKEG